MKEFFKKYYKGIIVSSLAITPILVSIISTIHVVNFFELSNYTWLAIVLAIAFALISVLVIHIMLMISLLICYTLTLSGYSLGQSCLH